VTETPHPQREPGAPAADRFAAQLRGFGPVGMLAILAILAVDVFASPLAALLVLAWAWRSRTPWREIGYVRPASWLGGLAVGVVFGAAFKLAMKALVMPIFGAPPMNRAFQFLAGNPAALPGFVLQIVLSAGFAEETIFRGFFFERLGKLWGKRPGARVATVVVSAAYFGMLHYHVQGWPGVQQAVFVGLVFGAIFAVTGRLWMLMCAHIAFDLTAGALIYWGLETRVAHLLFR
jgi:hypothetical protein